MKAIYYFLALFFLLLQVQCNGQEDISESKSNELSFQLKLRQYEIDSCLVDFLYAIVEADSGQSRYPPDIYGYSLQLFEQMPSYCTIIIKPYRWTKKLPNDCSGVIEIEGMSFLCFGVTKESPLLFKDTGVDLVKNFSIIDTPVYDSLDLRDKAAHRIISQTALVGVYEGCKPGYSVRLHIDVGKNLKGVKVKGGGE